MPGIVCIIGQRSHPDHRKDLGLMVDVMNGESFYSSGTYVSEENGLYAGWTCLRGSFSDCMPVMNDRKDLVLFFYGEHHFDRRNGSAPHGGGGERSRYDARLVLRLYEEQGEGFLRTLNGWFQGILVDLRRGTATVFNDRYGMQRLYYAEDADSVVFASEAKSILAVRRRLRSLDPRSVGEYLACDCVLEDRTLFRGIRRLPGGSSWTFRRGRLERKGTYFEPREWESQPPLEEGAFARELAALFPRVMERYVASDQPVGISLSGGLDTRQLMAYIDSSRFRVSCYTFDSMYRESRDARLARKVAAACGQSHRRLTLGEEYLASFPSVCERSVYVSDGCLGAGESYELYLNRQAREIAPVRLTGSYGSEVFRGLRGFKAVRPNGQLVHPEYGKHVDAAMQTFDEINSCPGLTFSVFRQAPWFGYGRASVEQSQVVLRTPFMDNDLMRLLYQAPESARSTTQVQWRLIEQGNPALVNIPTDRGLRGRSGPLAARWVYLRSYFLFKADYLYKSGMPQWMERIHHALGPFQPERLLVGRHRFYHFRIWFRKQLASYVKDVLLDPAARRRPYVNGDFLEPMVLRHLRGDRNYTQEIDKALTMELIHRQFVD